MRLDGALIKIVGLGNCGGVFDVINKLLKDIGNVSLAHTFREGNDLADSLAKSGVGRSFMLEKSFNFAL